MGVKEVEAQQLATILANGPLVVDGAMATELEKKGVDTANNLWSATALLNAPSAIKEVHRSYFVAGANIVLTNSYQANLPAFEAHGFSEDEGQHLIQKAVQLAQTARDEYAQTLPADKKRPLLIAGSVGPYGAYLANGSEYTGDYLLSKEEYKNFHRPRMQALAQAGVDLFAFETQPNFAETQALAELLYEEFPEMLAWLSFSVDGKDKLCDGTPLKQAVSYFVDDDQIVAIGVNCTSPANVTELLKIMQTKTTKPLVVYPNNGDTYDPLAKKWQTDHDTPSFSKLVPQWQHAGASLIGGCCQTTPADIEEIARNIQNIKNE